MARLLVVIILGVTIVDHDVAARRNKLIDIGVRQERLVKESLRGSHPSYMLV